MLSGNFTMKFNSFFIFFILFILNINYDNCLCADKKRQIKILLLEPKASSNDQINSLYKHIRDKLNKYEQIYIFNNDEIENASDGSIRLGKERIQYLDKKLNIDNILRIFIKQSENFTTIRVYSIVHPSEQMSPSPIIESTFDINNFVVKKIAKEIGDGIIRNLYPLQANIDKKRKNKILLECAIVSGVVIISAICFSKANIKKNKNQLPDPPDFPQN